MVLLPSGCGKLVLLCPARSASGVGHSTAKQILRPMKAHLHISQPSLQIELRLETSHVGSVCLLNLGAAEIYQHFF